MFASSLKVAKTLTGTISFWGIVVGRRAQIENRLHWVVEYTWKVYTRDNRSIRLHIASIKRQDVMTIFPSFPPQVPFRFEVL